MGVSCDRVNGLIKDEQEVDRLDNEPEVLLLLDAINAKDGTGVWESRASGVGARGSVGESREPPRVQPLPELGWELSDSLDSFVCLGSISVAGRYFASWLAWWIASKDSCTVCVVMAGPKDVQAKGLQDDG